MDRTKRYDRVVFLDRDGVINTDPPDPGWVMRWEDFQFAHGALDALRRLREHGFAVAVVTNQSCVSRGLTSRENIEDVLDRMTRAVADAGGRLDGVYFCPHVDADDCACRKPRPGMLDRAAGELGVDPSRAFLVGDRETDVALGRTRGCTTLLVRAPHNSPDETQADHVVADLAEAVDVMLRLVGPERGSQS